MKLRATFACIGLLAGCGDRNEFWDQQLPQQAQTFGLQASVVALDAPADRALVFRSRGGELLQQSLPVGRNVVATAVSTDLRRLALLAAGDSVQDEPDDPKPQLTVLEAAPGAEPAVRTFPLAAPHSGLVLDPRGEFAVVHASPSAQGSVQLAENPNELIFVNLSNGALVTRSLRSFGGKPQRFTFTPPLGLPGGTRRLLVIETEQDLALIDLAHLDRPEITVRLTSGQDARVVQPAGVVFDDGDVSRDDDTRLAVRTQNGNDVVTLTLLPAPETPNGFKPVINLASAGGVVSDLAFVQTDAGLRVAALVPSARKAVLIEPDTSRTVDVDLGAPHRQHAAVLAARDRRERKRAALETAERWALRRVAPERDARACAPGYAVEQDGRERAAGRALVGPDLEPHGRSREVGRQLEIERDVRLGLASRCNGHRSDERQERHERTRSTTHG